MPAGTTYHTQRAARPVGVARGQLSPRAVTKLPTRPAVGERSVLIVEAPLSGGRSVSRRPQVNSSGQSSDRCDWRTRWGPQGSIHRRQDTTSSWYIPFVEWSSCCTPTRSVPAATSPCPTRQRRLQCRHRHRPHNCRTPHQGFLSRRFCRPHREHAARRTHPRPTGEQPVCLRHTMFDTMGPTCPAGTVAGGTRSIMWPPNGAVPPIIWVIPMSPSITATVVPGSEGGAEHVNREKAYPGAPPTSQARSDHRQRPTPRPSSPTRPERWPQ